MENKKITRQDFMQSIVDKSNRELVQEIISQIKKSGIELSEKESRHLFALLITTNCSKKMVGIIFKNIEDLIKDNLYKTNEKCSIVMKIFKGISIKAQYVPERIKINNFSGKKEKYKAYIKPKAEFSRSFIEDISKNPK